MKITTGIDIIEVERIKTAIEKQKTAFLNRVFTKNEIEYCSNSGDSIKYQHYAARFAAKEAVFKAISSYILDREDGIWTGIEIINNESGKPEVNVENLQKNIHLTADNLKIKDIDISLSHIKEYAIASVVVVFDTN